MVKDVIGFEGLYTVDTSGVIYTIRKGNRPMKTYIINTGYEAIKLVDIRGKRHSLLVHRIVGDAFISKDSTTFEINHIDSNRLNNTSINLEWVSRSANIKHSYKHGGHTKDMCKSYRGLKHKSNTSGYHNVTYDKARDKWLGGITHNCKVLERRRFDTAKEAAIHVNFIIVKYGLQGLRPKNIIII